MAKAKRKTKAEELQEAVAEAVGAGRELHLESVDFSDPNRPKTCLEVDFPILSINALASVESTSGAARKPIYLATKWWARRAPSVFRAMLLSAAAKVPLDESQAASYIWSSYYGNHQQNLAFQELRVADIFMGGGTTVIEGVRLGMKMSALDLNPVAWFVVNNELADVSLSEVESLIARIEQEIKPQIMPFFSCDCPRGHKGVWRHRSTDQEMGEEFDPLSISEAERGAYEYEGPEVIYTFWGKHGPCQATECGHRTPIFSTPVIANKSLSVKTWANWECPACEKLFDLESQDARIAPDSDLVIADTEGPFSTIADDGTFCCPHCEHQFVYQSRNKALVANGRTVNLGSPKTKKIALSLLINPVWLQGSSSKDDRGNSYGGTVDSCSESTRRWHKKRQESLSLIEVRGQLPEQITCPKTSRRFYTDKRGGTVPKSAAFTCQEPTCGLGQDVLTSVKQSGSSGPIAPYAIQGFCPQCNEERRPYSGRFFALPNIRHFDVANAEWERLRDSEFADCWPKSELPYAFMTHHNNGGLPNHGYTHWWKMFNGRQLLIHSRFFRLLSDQINSKAGELVAGIMPQVLRANCSLSFWHRIQDCIEPTLGAANFHPKPTTVENCVFNDRMGRGTFRAYAKTLLEALRFKEEPWDLVSLEPLKAELDIEGGAKTMKIPTGDVVTNHQQIECGSATDIKFLADRSTDLVITDPPFGGLMHYSELSDFFYVWLRLLLKSKYPAQFDGEYTPKALEAVSNRARHGKDADSFYERILTQCWKESHRILKDGGILAFTFHHSEDEPWVNVLESLFDAGFYLEATYPIRSDDTKGEGGKPGTFGSQLIEFDIIHVCRKRLEEPEPISWARLRRQILIDVRQLQEIIEHHQKEGLGEADLQVIRRGKALEYYSRHYGKVYIEKGREDEFTVKDALVGINQLLNDESDTTSEAPPVLAEPYTRQFLRLFADKSTLERDQMQKYLRGTGVSPSEFLERGWCSEEKKIFTITHPLDWATQWKGKPRKGMSRDFDQTYFLIGACYEDSGIKLSDTLSSGSFVPHPAISDLLDWFGKHGSDTDIRDAARMAKKIYSSWLAKNTKQEVSQRTLFDLLEDE